MLVKDKFRLKAMGRVTILHNDQIIYEDKWNTIMSFAKEIAAKRLIQHPSSAIDKIRIYDGITLVQEIPISATSILAPQQVQFNGDFTAYPFASHFDRIALAASAIGNFAELSGLDVTKLLSEPLLIIWKIKIV